MRMNTLPRNVSGAFGQPNAATLKRFFREGDAQRLVPDVLRLDTSYP
ncbi:MAG: hypothetical protein HZB55_16770 [Deltaproteobacteria bacterium]|nr:hypothetical protein [Deltaproteobacteria bacterium]